VQKLEQRRVFYLQADKKGMAEAVAALITKVRAEREGAFSALSQYPSIAAIVLPSSGIGAWALLEYAAKTFGGSL
jgi:hypothetical protein